MKDSKLNSEAAGNLRLALAWARAGFPVFPCRGRGPVEGLKRPHTEHGFKDATTEARQIKAWWKRWPDAVPGIPTGEASGLAVLDLDQKNGKDGAATLAAMGIPPRSPFVVQTPSGGTHHIFKHVEGLKNTSGKTPAGEKAPGVDVRAEGGYFIAPGAVMADGKRYAEIGREKLIGSVIEVPDWPLDDLPLPHHRVSETEDDRPAMPLTDIRDIVYDLNYAEWCDGDRDAYLKVLMAIHHASGGSDAGMALAREWAKQSPQFNAGHFRRDWTSLDVESDNPVTIASLIPHAPNYRPPFDLAWFDDGVEEADQTVEPNCNPLRSINRTHAVVTIGGKTTIMTISGGGVSFGSEADFRLRYKNRPFRDRQSEIAELAGSAKPPRRTLADAWITWKDRREYPGGIVFRPDGEAPDRSYNLWRGWAVKGDSRASCALFLDHLRMVICNGDDDHFQWLLGWMAHLVQRPGEKPRSAIVLRGEKGAGKDIAAAYVSRLMRPTAYLNTADQDAVWGQFNGAIASKLFLHLEEAFFSGDHKADSRIKNLITAATQTINEKFAPLITVDSFHRLWITSNELRVVNSTAGERRYFISEVSDHRCGDKPYFDALIAEMNGAGPTALMHRLRTFDLSAWDSRPPATEALIESIAGNLTGIAAWMHDCIEERRLVGEEGFEWPDDWESTARIRAAFDGWARSPSNRYRGVNVTGQAFGKQIAPFLDRPRKLIGPRNCREYHYLLKSWSDAREALDAIITKGNPT